MAKIQHWWSILPNHHKKELDYIFSIKKYVIYYK